MSLFQFQPRSVARRHGWLLLAVLSLCATGCTRWTQQWNSLRNTVRGKGYSDDSVDWTRNVRAPADSTPMAGVDERARQIERNLGVR